MSGLPSGLLRAVGIVESGRWQPERNRVAPWPYAIDAGGYSLFMENLADAVAKVGALRLQGFDSIDVGCFQINLMYHPAAFATLEEAFDPRANAAYAARFLLSLHAREGSWEAAVADYHSGVASVGEPYRAKVYSAWHGAPDSAPGYRGFGGGVVRVISMTPFAAPLLHTSVRVFVPTVLASSVPQALPAIGLQARARMPLPASRPVRRGLPTVFTPTSRI